MKNSENYENFINKSKSTKTNVFKKQRNYENDSENYENFINKSKSTKTNVKKNSEITKMILKIMKTNLKIVKNKNKIFFKCKCKKSWNMQNVSKLL